MLKSLQFAQGAVSKRDLLPSLTHFKISENKIKSFNGTIALCSPIPLDIECLPKAIPLVKAIQNCHEAVSITLLKNDKLKINSGVFSASIECLKDRENFFPEPEGEEIEINGKVLLEAIRVLEPFLSNDASRQWANGILFKEQSAFVTNNIIMIEYWLGNVFPQVCNIPHMAIKELLRIGEAPNKIQYNSKSMTFHYDNDRWLNTLQYSVDWPDINRVLDVTTNPEIISPDLFEGLGKLRPFADELKRVYLDGNVMSTSLDEYAGARFNLSSEYPKCVFNLNMLESLKDVAKQMDFSLFPRPCLFYGERLRGAIAGMKLE